MSIVWQEIKPPYRCGCGNLATVKMRDLHLSIVEYLCTGCGEAKRELRRATVKAGRKKGFKNFHNEFGRANSDVSSGVASSIPNWGNKIKARA